MFEWTDERIERLKRERLAGATCSEIATKLGGGLSRNAVIGKASRLKIPSPKSAASKKVLNERRRQASKLVIRVAQEREPAPPAPAKPSLTEQDAVAKKGWPKPMTATAVLFLNLPTRGRCRFPLWADDAPIDQRFCCGAEMVADAPYCDACRKVAFTPAYNQMRKAS